MTRAVKQLRAVAAGERQRPKTIKAAAEVSERELLIALRNRLAAELDGGDVPAHAIRGLIAELRDVDKSLRTLDERIAGPDSVVATTDDESFDTSSV